MSDQDIEWVMRQVPIPVTISAAIKAYAKEKGMLLREAHDEAIIWFIRYKRKTGESLFYLVSPSSSKYVSMWIKSPTLSKIKALAEVDDVKENRLIFSALVYFLKEKEYIPK